jgi:hypothetical protein
MSGREEIAGAAKLMALDDGSALFALNAPWPRAWRVPAAERLDDATAATRMADPAWDPMGLVLLAEDAADSAGGATESGVASDSGSSTLTAVTIPAPGEVLVDTEGAAAAWVVVSEIHDPAWRATIDGRAAPVLRADLGLLAVEVPAGKHELVLRYRPRTVPLGIGLSLLSAVILLTAGIHGRRRARRALPASTGLTAYEESS